MWLVLNIVIASLAKSYIEMPLRGCMSETESDASYVFDSEGDVAEFIPIDSRRDEENTRQIYQSAKV